MRIAAYVVVIVVAVVNAGWIRIGVAAVVVVAVAVIVAGIDEVGVSHKFVGVRALVDRRSRRIRRRRHRHTASVTFR